MEMGMLEFMGFLYKGKAYTVERVKMFHRAHGA